VLAESTGRDPTVIILIGVNLALGLGCAVPLAARLSQIGGGRARPVRFFAVLVGAYFVESVALALGMGIPVLNVGLAFVWGLVIGRWLRTCRSAADALPTALMLSAYSSLPAVSFLVVPLSVWVGGWAVLSAKAGAAFGIPAAFPWPTNTILGFYATLAIGAVAAKAAITGGVVRLLVRRGRPHAIP